MELAELIQSLADPAAYPGMVDEIEVRQTHISVVFLAGGVVYKIKKPVALGFCDFSTLARRLHYCQEELRLNRRLAGDVYRDVVPIVADGARLKVEGDGEPIEWAVKMRRLPDEATLEHRVEHNAVSRETIECLARKIAAFHASADRGKHISACGRFEVVARNARDNFEQSSSTVGATVSEPVFDRLQSLAEKALACLRPLIEARAERGVPCDTHGDLRLEHVYLPEEPVTADRIVVLDCVEFNEMLRFADPVSDMAFLVMGLKSIGRHDLAVSFDEAYFSASKDEEGRALLPFYTAYRAAVRGKVEAIKLAESEVAPRDRADSAARARGYWLLALGELERPGSRPCLVMVAGLPGSGKSTLAADLAERGCFEVIRSDVVRKELAGASSGQPPTLGYEQGIYTAEWTERTYAECLRRAEALLFEGRRVIVDANFGSETQRTRFFQTARGLCVRTLFLACQAPSELIRQRLAARRGDASDADWSIYEQAARAWQEPAAGTVPAWNVVATTGPRQRAIEQALAILHRHGLATDLSK